jgi:hypothetical protein
MALILAGCGRSSTLTAPTALPPVAFVHGTVTILYGENQIPGRGMIVCVNGDFAHAVDTDSLGRYEIHVDHPGPTLRVVAATPSPPPGYGTIGGAGGSVTVPTVAYATANIIAIFQPI